MKFKKQDILTALKTITVPGAGENMVDSGAVTNVLTFCLLYTSPSPRDS